MDNKPNEATIEVIYNESVRQYNLILNSHNGLNNKAIGIIAFNGTLLSLFSLSVVQFINSQHLNDLQIFLSCITISYLFIIFSIICSIYAYHVIKFGSIDVKTLHTEYYIESRQTVLDQLCSNISNDSEKIRKLLDRRGKFINYSLFFSMIGVICICISLIYGFYSIP
ncbi:MULTISPECIES: hypothetical protein [Methanobacterium]|uniref:Pycsar effector protein domain-containing protein n=1 Tax=Methanobacterium veterum TaxID=408577 RepID=A0A9E5A889_9EURY|nr:MULTISPECIES: hypothetical protein [Methanobacterium]MCZ3366668.1 hypothetical protein [Methanobacterium veterum]MCZ3374187.1 hypothetical protein [Methanobacterium veterum]